METLFMRPRISKTDFAGRLTLYLATKPREGRCEVVTGVSMVPYDTSSALPENILGIRVAEEDAQVLMDDLYAGGFRPTQGKSSIGQAAALEAHVESLKSITANLFVMLDKALTKEIRV